MLENIFATLNFGIHDQSNLTGGKVAVTVERGDECYDTGTRQHGHAERPGSHSDNQLAYSTNE